MQPTPPNHRAIMPMMMMMRMMMMMMMMMMSGCGWCCRGGRPGHEHPRHVDDPHRANMPMIMVRGVASAAAADARA